MKDSIQISVIFIYTSKKIQNEIKKTITFTVAWEIIKCFRVSLIKMQDVL